MKKHTLAVWSGAVLAAAVLAGCSTNKAVETTAAASAEVTAAEETSTEAPAEPAKEEKTKFDMVVAGGSGSGLIAAIQAVQEGADPSGILVIEASGELGADLASMESFVNAADTSEQFDEEIEDSYEQYLADMKAAGNGKNNEELAEFLTETGEEVLDWLRGMDIAVAGLEKEEGHSAARSYTAEGKQELQAALQETLLKKLEDLKVQVMKDTEVKEILFEDDGRVKGLILAGKDGEKAIECVSLVLTDNDLLPLLDGPSIQFTKAADGKNSGVVVNTCAEVLDEGGESVPGLYAAGALIGPAVHGEKALAGNEMTATVLFGVTAGTEAGMYATDNRIE